MKNPKPQILNPKSESPNKVKNYNILTLFGNSDIRKFGFKLIGILLVISSAIGGSLVIPRPVGAADRSLNMVGGIGAGYYYLYPKDSQIKDYYGGGLNWRAFMEFMAESGLSAAGEVGIYYERNRSSAAPAGTSLTIIPVTASLKYYLFKGSALSPYLGGGVGLYNINESDPDFNYLKTMKFGKHILLGADLYFTPDTIFRAELRQTFIDPVNSSLYYEANFGGLTGLVGLAVEWPLWGPEAEMTREERALLWQKRRYEAELQDRLNRLREMETFYRQQEWNEILYQRWKSREVLLQEINQTKEQVEEARAKAEQLKNELEQKRKQYLEERARKRQEKKEATIRPQP